MINVFNSNNECVKSSSNRFFRMINGVAAFYDYKAKADVKPSASICANYHIECGQGHDHQNGGKWYEITALSGYRLEISKGQGQTTKVGNKAKAKNPMAAALLSMLDNDRTSVADIAIELGMDKAKANKALATANKAMKDYEDAKAKAEKAKALATDTKTKADQAVAEYWGMILQAIESADSDALTLALATATANKAKAIKADKAKADKVGKKATKADTAKAKTTKADTAKAKTTKADTAKAKK